MHIYPTNQKKTVMQILLPVMISIIVLGLFIGGFTIASDSANRERYIATERLIHNALIQCYAIEGIYPQKLSYLEEHYGLIIDYEKYVVFYETLGSNILPSVRVVPIGSGEHNAIAS